MKYLWKVPFWKKLFANPIEIWVLFSFQDLNSSFVAILLKILKLLNLKTFWILKFKSLSYFSKIWCILTIFYSFRTLLSEVIYHNVLNKYWMIWVMALGAEVVDWKHRLYYWRFWSETLLEILIQVFRGILKLTYLFCILANACNSFWTKIVRNVHQHVHFAKQTFLKGEAIDIISCFYLEWEFIFLISFKKVNIDQVIYLNFSRDHFFLWNLFDGNNVIILK